MAGLLGGAGVGEVEAVTVAFTHIADQEVWWSGPTRGVATIGVIVTAQRPRWWP